MLNFWKTQNTQRLFEGQNCVKIHNVFSVSHKMILIQGQEAVSTHMQSQQWIIIIWNVQQLSHFKMVYAREVLCQYTREMWHEVKSFTSQEYI